MSGRRSGAWRETSMVSAHDFKFRELAGAGSLDLAGYSGSVLLIVNVASACGFTPQYRDLEALYQAKRAKGFAIIGVPSNDFGAQEPGDEPRIKQFCETSYKVSFPMTGKVDILGPSRHPFYDWVAEVGGSQALPRWNFHKYLIGKKGELLDSFPANSAPLGPEMLAAIEKALAA